MRDEALFLNGVYDSVLQEILEIQRYLPEQILYLQPYRDERIVHLAENPPSVDSPVRLFVSITDDLPMVHYVGEIVGWDDKRKLSEPKLKALNRVIKHLQKGEESVYEYIEDPQKLCVNLLHVRRLRQLPQPFSVGKLTNVKDGQPLSTNRTQSGGWVYVKNPGEVWLADYLKS